MSEPAKCPEPGCESTGGTYIECPRCGAVGGGAKSVPPVDPAVLDRAVEAGVAEKERFIGKCERATVEDIVRAAAPVLIEAERERIKARIEKAATEAWEVDPRNLPGPHELHAEMMKVFDAALSVIDEKPALDVVYDDRVPRGEVWFTNWGKDG